MNIRISQPQCYTARGQKPNQEDALFPPKEKVTEKNRVFLVCDGMGGHEHGEVASNCVADTIGRLTADQPLCSTEEMRSTFEKALSQAYHNLDELDHSESEKKMGTTLTFLAICSDGVQVAHIGDSRVYQLRPGKGILFQTRDHSLVNDLIASGELTEEEARNFPQRNVITRAIQPHQEYPAKAVYNVLTDIQAGDVFFLCCDGVVEQIDNKDLCSILLNGDTPDKRIAAIEKECEARGTRDNNTAYLIEVAEAKGMDSVQLKSVEVCDTQPSDTQRMPPKSNRSLIIIVLALIVIVGLIAYIFLSGASDNKKDQPRKMQQTEQTQGTIQRNKR